VGTSSTTFDFVAQYKELEQRGKHRLDVELIPADHRRQTLKKSLSPSTKKNDDTASVRVSVGVGDWEAILYENSKKVWRLTITSGGGVSTSEQIEPDSTFVTGNLTLTEEPAHLGAWIFDENKSYGTVFKSKQESAKFAAVYEVTHKSKVKNYELPSVVVNGFGYNVLPLDTALESGDVIKSWAKGANGKKFNEQVRTIGS
jgi:hypothetical protein